MSSLELRIWWDEYRKRPWGEYQPEFPADPESPLTFLQSLGE